jgi:hypothetical protein
VGSSKSVVRGIASAVGLTVLLSLAAASRARAEALPGRFEVSVGANVFALVGRRCEQGGDVVSCSDFWPFAGFELAARDQVIAWLSVGVRAAGGKDLDGATMLSSDGTELDRDLWLWRGSAEVRFDPPIWPRGIWFAGELGAAMFVDAVETRTVDDRFAGGSSSRGFGLLAGLAAGWDFPLTEHLVLGTEVRVQYIAAPKLDVPDTESERVTLEDFPYVSLAVRLAFRW